MRVLLPVDRRCIKESDRSYSGSSSDKTDNGAAQLDPESQSKEDRISGSSADVVVEDKGKPANYSGYFESPQQSLKERSDRLSNCSKTPERLKVPAANEKATFQEHSCINEVAALPIGAHSGSPFVASDECHRPFPAQDQQRNPTAAFRGPTDRIGSSASEPVARYKRTVSGTRKDTEKPVVQGANGSSKASKFSSFRANGPRGIAVRSSHESTLQGPAPASGKQSQKPARAASSAHLKGERDLAVPSIAQGSGFELSSQAGTVARAQQVRSKRKKTSCTMAVGGRLPRNDDDEGSCASNADMSGRQGVPPRYSWNHPVENEPPMLQNNPVPSFSIEVSNGAPDPASDDERELPESSQSSTEALPPTSAGSFAGAVAENKQESDLQIERFEEALKKQGLEMVEQEGDGNCLFRAVSLQVYGSADNHAEVRERCMDFMARNEEHYSNFVAIGSRETDADAVPVARAASAFQDYVARKRIIGVHGNHAEIQAISELFNRPIEVYTPPEVDGKSDQADPSPLQPMNFHAEYKTNDPPIRLSFHDGNHYNAVIDPLVPTAGLGLGLPGLKPGLADQLQITKAKTESDQLADEAELQRILKESHDEKDDELQRVLKQTSMDYMYQQKTMAMTDLDATNYELEQKAIASSMESYYRQEHDRKQKASGPAGAAASGRRRRGSPPPPAPPDEQYNSMFASAPSVAASAAGGAVSDPSVASLPPASAASRSSPNFSFSNLPATDEEYPQTVQELVMNGFELEKVVRAYELFGDHFDDLFAYLLASSSSSS